VFATLFLITAFVVNRQFFHMDHADLGFETDDLLYLRLRDETRNKSNVLKSDLLNVPGISGVTSTSHLPVMITGGYYQTWGRSDEKDRYLGAAAVDYDYVETMRVAMSQGRFYSEEFSSDSVNAVVVNETAIEAMGWEEPVGKQFFYRNEYYTIIGVMKDFHHVPLVMKITPLIFRLRPRGNDYLLVRLNPANETERARILERIEAAWSGIFPDFPIEYNFMDDFQFPQERTIHAAERLMWYFTILAILISGMGLYGLSTFMAERRTKEIGIRKVLGASSNHIVKIFSRDYLRIFILALLIAWPVGWLLMKKFLGVFAYRMNLSIWLFLVVGVFMCLLALLSVGFQAWRSSVQDPAVTLRYE
jgi:putative ABC transport system permease protein